jgi:hypothetical protein
MYSNNPNLRSHSEKIEYTPHMQSELLKCMEDVIYFAEHYCQIITIDGGKQLIKLWDFQKKLLKAFRNPPDKKRGIILKCPRQSSKCLVGDTKIKIRNKKTGEIKEISMEEFHQSQEQPITKLNDVKFIEQIETSDWQVETETGWEDISSSNKTIKYQIWKVQIGPYFLECADNHIVIDEFYDEIFVKDLFIGQKIRTQAGLQQVLKLVQSDDFENMYDLSVNSKDHTYYTNKILSHNTTISSIFILHQAIFNKDQNVAILANKETTSLDILRRVKMMYENLPLWIQVGIIDGGWNAKTVQLANGSRLVAAATGGAAVRGQTFNLLYLDEFAFVPNNVADDFMKSVYPTIISGKSSKVIISSCVTDDTYVFTDSGPKQINDFIEKEKEGFYDIKPYKIEGFNKINNGFTLYNNGKKETNIIETALSKIECTNNHKLWACKNGVYGWYEAEQLNVGDYLAIKYGMELWGKNDELKIDRKNYGNRCKNFPNVDHITTDLAYLFGLYISEGHYWEKFENGVVTTSILTIACGDTQVVKDVLNKLGLTYYNTGIRFNICSKCLYDIFKEVGFDLRKKAKVKVIPKRLFEMSRENIIAMMQGIYDGDGCSANKFGKVFISLSSPILIEQIRMLLLNFGIPSMSFFGITPPTLKSKVSSNYYRLELSKSDSHTYYEKVGFRIERKQQNKNRLPINITRNSHDVIPFSKEILRNICKEEHKSLISLCSIFKDSAKKSAPHFSRTLMLRYKEILNNTNISKLNKLMENVEKNIKWVEIKNITKSVNDTYDFALNDVENDKWCHSVVYSGIVGHQTPKGLNYYFTMWDNAKKGRNSFYPIAIRWQDVPTYRQDPNFKKRVIEDIGLVSFSQEFDCLAPDTTITIQDSYTYKTKKVTLQEFYTINELLFDKKIIKIAPNYYHYKVLTPEGFKEFAGIIKYPKRKTTTISTINEKVSCSTNHPFIINNKKISASKLKVEDTLDTKNGLEVITDIQHNDIKQNLFDLLDVQSINHAYYTSNIISSNCKFIGSTSTLIEGECLEDINVIEPIDIKYNGLFEIFEQPKPNAFYILGIDSAEGVGSDESTIQVVRIDNEVSLEQVAVYHNNMIDPFQFAEVCIAISEYYNNAGMMVESNNIGQVVANCIWYDHENESIINCDKRGLGIKSTKKTKLEGCMFLKRYIENKFIKLNHRATAYQLSKYEEKSPGIFGNASNDDHDDLVSGLIWAIYFISTPFFDGKNMAVKKISDKFRLNRPDMEDDLGVAIIDNAFKINNGNMYNDADGEEF